MSVPIKYMAASVPRFIRLSRAGFLQPRCLLGSRLMKGDGGQNISFDIIMLPAQQFFRMKTHIGQQHIAAPALKLGPTFPMSFVLTDIREVIVPPDEPDPEGYARQHFMIEFGLIGPNAPGTESAKAPDDNGSES